MIRLHRFCCSRRREEGGGEGDGCARDGRRQRPTRWHCPTMTKGSWEGSAVFSLGVTASFLIKDMIGHDSVQNCIIEFYMIGRKIYLGKRRNRDSGFTVAHASVAPVPL
jgi:hypothetical protein